MSDDRLQELRDAIAWNQRQGIGHVVLTTELVEWVIAEVERLHSQVDSGFARNYGLNKGIENAVDAFVKAAAERDGWKKAALRLKDAARLLRKSGQSDLQRVRELEAERDRWEHSAEVRADLLAEARVERDELKRELANAEHGADLIAEEREAYKASVAMLQQERGSLYKELARVTAHREGLAKEWVQLKHDLGQAQVEAVRLRALLQRARGYVMGPPPESPMHGKSLADDFRREIEEALAGGAPISEDTAVMLERVWYRP